MATSTDVPPSFKPHSTEIISVKDSQITNVSLYSSRAEITRVFRLNVKVGINQVNVSGLPNALDQESLKVEGVGRATIHDVTISSIPAPTKPTTSNNLEKLSHKKKKTEQAIDRCSLAIKSLQTYLGTLNVKDVGATVVAGVIQNYQIKAEELDDQSDQLQLELENIESQLNVERKSLAGPAENQDLRMKIAVGIFADAEEEVEIRFVYAVGKAHWSALYDIRVDTHAGEKPVEVTYKASISQSTGEDWNELDLTLETAEPTFGLDAPHLFPWIVSVHRPITIGGPGSKGLSVTERLRDPTPTAYSSLAQIPPMQHQPVVRQPMAHQETNINSRGNVTATFSVPGKITIPSDGAAHNVTIAKLNLDAKMRWITTPKQEARTHLSAKIKNASDYALLSGPASIYVDGSFIARTDLPPVSPQESFDCPLGLDPSIRITYHPRSKKTIRTGFYNKITTQIFNQRITIFNTKTNAIEDLKVTDQFPVSDDSTITVRQISPALANVLKETTSGEIKRPDKVKVTSDVLAQWNGTDEPDVNVESLGRDGKFDWICVVPPQGKIDLHLQYEVIAPPRAQITGL